MNYLYFPTIVAMVVGLVWFILSRLIPQYRNHKNGYKKARLWFILTLAGLATTHFAGLILEPLEMSGLVDHLTALTIAKHLSTVGRWWTMAAGYVFITRKVVDEHKVTNLEKS